MRKVVYRHGTVDPIEIAKREEIPIRRQRMPKSWKTNALTYPVLGIPTIILNRGLSREDERLLICHELTHALFDAPEMASYLDRLKQPDVRSRQRERRAWDAAYWLFVMDGIHKLGFNWRIADRLWERALGA
jgi:Zn-dependent peptidase ImmA (M78 family)